MRGLLFAGLLCCTGFAAAQERLEATTMTTPAMAPEQFSRIVAEQWENWGKVVRDNNITAN